MATKVVAAGLEDRIGRIAGRQHGLITHSQLLDAGLGASGVKKRVNSRRLRRVHRGVYLVGHQPLREGGRWLAAVLACGPRAVLSHQPAAVLLGLIPTADGAIDVTVPTPGGRKSRDGFRVHRCKVYSGEVTRKTGIPVTTVARTLIDLAAVAPERRVERALDEADYLGLLNHAALESTLARNSNRKGSRVLRRIVAEHEIGSTRTRTELEERFLAICARRGLQQPEVNREVEGFEVDFSWPDLRLVVETDGYAAHRKRRAFEADRTRDVILHVEGWDVLRFSYRQVLAKPEWVADHVERALSVRR
jgi:very-short-patch-repair endonuclease